MPRVVNGSSALTLLNCKIGPALGGGDFRLVPDANVVGPVVAAKLQSLQSAIAKLSTLGFSNASAGSLAYDYVNHPRSRNAQLVAKALNGSQQAVAILKQSNP